MPTCRRNRAASFAGPVLPAACCGGVWAPRMIRFTKEENLCGIRQFCSIWTAFLIESEWLMRATAIQALADYGIRAKDEDFMEFTGCGEDRFIGGVAEKHGAVYDKAMKELAYDYYGKRVMTEVEIPAGVGGDAASAPCPGIEAGGLLGGGSAEGEVQSGRRRRAGVPVHRPGHRVRRGGGRNPSRISTWRERAGWAWSPGPAWWWRTPSAESPPGTAAGMDVAAVPTSFSRETLMKEAHPRVPAGPDRRFAEPGAAEVRNCDIVTESGHAMW